MAGYFLFEIIDQLFALLISYLLRLESLSGKVRTVLEKFQIRLADKAKSISNGSTKEKWPVVGRRNEQFDCLSFEKRMKTFSFTENFKEVQIETHDKIKLQAIVFNPKPTSRNSKNPVLIFISSWGLNKWEYVVPAHDYAKRGYTVISYTSRGFWGSGGVVNLAGPLDMKDVTTVIDWALANTHADPNRIGLSGISYGGGMSLLSAAHDQRVKSVVAMSCWVDLAQSFLGNGETIRKHAVRVLQGVGYLTGEIGEDLETLFSKYFSKTDLEYLYKIVRERSAVNFVDQINENKPAVFIANALSDSLFIPNQFPAFFDKLTGNKHIEFAPGDHTGPEGAGLFGLPDQVWQRARQWNDYYLRDEKTDRLVEMPRIVLTTSNDDDVEGFKTWDDMANSSLTYRLAKDERLIFSLKDAPLDQQTVDETIKTGDNAHINGGIAFVTASVRPPIEEPLHFIMKLIDRDYAVVFQTEPFPYTARLRGIAAISLNIIPKSSPSGTLVAYLLDVNPVTKIGKLITFAPWTFKNATVGEVLNLSMEMTMTSYDMPVKNSLALVIQTHDPLFLDQSPQDSQITFVNGSLMIPTHA
jgi:predicted acyl esterase